MKRRKQQNPSGHPDKFRGKRGPERSERRKAAEAAGISRHQMYQALQVANISEEEFERLIESEDLPTVTEMARVGQGEQSRPRVTKPKCCPHCGGSLD